MLPRILERLSHWAGRLRLEDVPDRIVARATSQVLSQLGTVRAGWDHPYGATVRAALGSPTQPDPARAAGALAALTSCLHFDDAAYSGHLSSAGVSVPLAYARALDLDGAELLTAVIAADECAARIGAAATLGPFRGQTAAHTYLVGAVAGRLRCEDACAQQWTAALSLALAAPPWSLLPAFVGSDAKVLAAAQAVRTGLDACDWARAGLSGPADIVEHPEGFLTRFAEVALPDVVTAGLGERWHVDTVSYKLHPGAPTLDAAVDCALALHADLLAANGVAVNGVSANGVAVNGAVLNGVIDGAEIVSVCVTTSLYSMLLEAAAEPYFDGPVTPVSALLFNTPYAVASALLTGSLTAADYAPAAVTEDRRWALAARVEVEQDDDMTGAALRCDVPFGAALRAAGDRAVPWLRAAGTDWLVELVGDLGPGAPTLEFAEKVTPARVQVRLRDGRTFTREQWIPLGAPGAATRRNHAALVRAKFLATGGDPAVADVVAGLRHASSADVQALVRAAIA